MAVLQVLKGLTPGQRFSLNHERNVLGRHPDCTIVLDVGAVSRQHAEIVAVGDEFYVEDLQSRNGTLVNGQLIPPRKRQRLHDNDRVKICDVLFTFHEDDTTNGEAGESSSLRSPPVELVGDENSVASGSTIMSTLDVKSSRVGGRPGGVNSDLRLKALLEITHNLVTAVGLDQVLPKILDSLFKIFAQADRGFVVLQEQEGGPLLPKAVKQRREGDEETIRISRTIVNQAMASKEAILSADAASDSRFDTSQSIADFRIRSMMCAPLVDSEGRALGVIQIDTLDQRSPFQQDDLDLLASVASQAALSVENAQLHASALRKQALERDLEVAQRVQRSIMPSQPPSVAGYEFFDFYEAANQVGGDYFDYVPLPGQRLGVIVADVAGKGISAALLMARLSADARYCLVAEPDAASAMRRLNAAFSGSGWEDRFVTVVLAIIDTASHQMTVANGGHMAPFLRRKGGTVEPLPNDATGLPLGVVAEYPYEQTTIPLAPGECVAMFTDGISEAMNAGGEQYGLKRIREQLANITPSVRDTGKRLLDDVQRFVGKHPQSDDMCLLCFGRSE